MPDLRLVPAASAPHSYAARGSGPSRAAFRGSAGRARIAHLATGEIRCLALQLVHPGERVELLRLVEHGAHDQPQPAATNTDDYTLSIEDAVALIECDGLPRTRRARLDQ